MGGGMGVNITVLKKPVWGGDYDQPYALGRVVSGWARITELRCGLGQVKTYWKIT